MKSIIIPTDFSECAENATNLGLELAKLHNHKVEFVHVVNAIESYVPVEPFTGVDMLNAEKISPYFNEQISEAKRQLSLLKKKAEAEQIAVETHLNFMPLYDEIQRIEKEKDAELIVMGSQGSKGLEEMLIGSNTQRMVRFAKKPVLTIKHPLAATEIKRIVFVSDFDEMEGNVKALDNVIQFAAPLLAEVEVLFINTPNYFEDTHSTETKIKHALSLSKNPDLDYHIYNDFSIEEGVNAFYNRYQFDLIAICTHGYTGIRRLFNSNITEGLVNHLDIPVLSLPLGE